MSYSTMSDSNVTLARRTVLAGIGGTAVATGVGTVAADQHGDADVVVTIDNVGADAWEVTEADGEDVAPIGEENPTMTLTVGTRYAFENGGGSAHPLAFRDGDDAPLVSQEEEDDGDDGGGSSGPSYGLTPLASGAFADDPDVNVTQDGDRIIFTVTEDLAQELDNYVCTVHSAMVGDIETEEPEADPDDQPAAETDDGAPGFGVAAAAAGIGGAVVYALRGGDTEE